MSNTSAEFLWGIWPIAIIHAVLRPFSPGRRGGSRTFVHPWIATTAARPPAPTPTGGATQQAIQQYERPDSQSTQTSHRKTQHPLVGPNLGGDAQRIRTSRIRHDAAGRGVPHLGVRRAPQRIWGTDHGTHGV
jgi:hypothetical protein